MSEDPNPYSSPQTESYAHEQEPAPTGTFGVINARFMRLLGEQGGPLLAIWVILALLGLPSQLINVKSQELMLTDMGIAFGMIGLVYAIGLVISTLHYTSFAVMKHTEDVRGDLSVSEGFSRLLDRFVPTMVTSLLYFVSVGIGAIFCLVPGLLAALAFMMAPFIAANYERGPVESMKMSLDWVKRHAEVIAIMIGIGIGYGVIIGGIAMFLMIVMTGGMQTMAGGSPGYAPTLAVWFITSVTGYFMWLYVGSCFITIARAEEAQPGSFLGGPVAVNQADAFHDQPSEW